MIPRKYFVGIVGLLFLSIAAGLGFWPFLPRAAAIHWDMHDRADGYAPRAIAAMIFPLINVIAVGLAMLAPRWRAFHRRVVRMGRVYGVVCLAIALSLFCIQVICMLVDIGVHLPIGQMILLVVGLLIVVIGNFMSKVRRNLFFGIRTPWTMSNDTVWERTHRIGSVLFFSLGIVIVLASLFAPLTAAAIVMATGLLLFTIWAIVYSAWLYHHLGNVDDSVS
jgi:uncharacterized membrane protein